ncbi:cell adhesion molecule 1-like isoform X2 [Hyperolius riggenbachi]|uniref:cell adhesion molecule 1-like isoform X2 n=1 Tax=Hyperolius riggenbachi TaxID=752182 RepID=UPI0035A2AD67
MLPPPSLRIRDMRQMEMSENQGIRVLLWIRIVIFLQLSSSEAGLHITSGSSPIQAPLRHNVTIPCFLTDDNRQELDLDLSTASVRWEITPIQGEQHRVYLLTNHVHTPFRPKSHIEQIDFKKGNASLFLQDVQESDEGEYTCSIFITPDKLTATIAVQVSARPAITLSSSEIAVEPEHEKSVICKVNRFYPKAITIRWFKSNKDSSNRSPLDKETCNSVPAENGDGTFNATSLVLVKPSSKAEDGDTYYCLVTHRSFSSDQAVDFILKVEEQPTTFQEWVIAVAVLLAVMVVIPLGIALALYCIGDCLTLSDIMASGTPEYGKELTLSCEFRKYIPGPLQVTWLKKDVMKPDLIIYKDGKICDNRYKHKESEENHIGCDYISSSFLTFLVDIRLDQRKKYVCKVEYPAIKQTKKSKLTTQVIAIPVVGAIMPDPAIPSAGQQMTLSCDICFFYPKEDLTVEWYKENEPLPAPNNEIKVDNNNLYNATSTVTLSLEMKDLGKKFQCKVSHHSMKTPEIREWTMKTP